MILTGDAGTLALTAGPRPARTPYHRPDTKYTYRAPPPLTSPLPPSNQIISRVHLLNVSAIDFRRVVDVDLLGSFLCAQAAARIMITQQQCQPLPTNDPNSNCPCRKQKLPKVALSCHLFTGIWVKMLRVTPAEAI